MNQTYYTTKEIAALLRIKPRTVERWCRRGDIEATRLPGVRSSWRIPHSAIIQIGGTHGQQAAPATVRR